MHVAGGGDGTGAGTGSVARSRTSARNSSMQQDSELPSGELSSLPLSRRSRECIFRAGDMAVRSCRIALVLAVLACSRAPESVHGTAGPAGVPTPEVPAGTGRRHTLTVDIDGAGSVASTPPGVACPGICSATFDAGTSVALTATAAPGQPFASWFWGCAGAAPCNVSVSGDVRVGARFGWPPANRCDTIAIPVLPQPVTRTVVSWDEDPNYCGRVYGDGSGNLYTNTEYTLSNETGVLLPVASLLVTLNAGFAAHTLQTKTEAHLTAYTPHGKVLSSTPLFGRHSAAGVQARGGIIGIEAECDVTKTIRVGRIDADGILTDTVELAEQGCLTSSSPSYLAGLVDAADRLLIATDGASLGSGAIPSDHIGARWFDSGGQPLTAWFDLGPGKPSFLPLIGGGVAIGFYPRWVASIASGESVLSAPPGFRDWLIEPVLGGTAYAGISTGIIHMIDPSSGETCGSLSVPGFFSLGGDGSLLHVDSQGRDRTTGVCTVTVYPNVLRTTSSAGPPSQAGRISNSTKPMEVTR